jgi:hypothetical protein
MSCPLCESLSLKDLKKLDEAIAIGDFSLAELAEVYGADPSLIRVHMERCLSATASGAEMLSALQSGLQQVAAKLKKEVDDEAYKYADRDTNVDGRGILPGYVAVLRELRETVLAINKIKSNEDTVRGINEKVVTPFINQSTRICVEEVSRLREEIFKVTPERAHGKLDNLIKDCLIRIGERLLNENVKGLPEAVSAALAN